MRWLHASAIVSSDRTLPELRLFRLATGEIGVSPTGVAGGCPLSNPGMQIPRFPGISLREAALHRRILELLGAGAASSACLLR